MERSELQAFYGGEYAARFNEIWHESEMWRAEAGHHVRMLASLIGERTRWLDAGCGTGWMLSKFPDTTRAGCDLAPDMLTEARKANPNALFFLEHDIREDVPEWRDGWDLVSCNGAPWSYFASMAEIHQLVHNLAAWTAPDGKLLMGMFDLLDYTGIETPYPARGEPIQPDVPAITGIFWAFVDAAGLHRMIAPAMEYWLDLYSQYFKRIEIVRWPHDPPFLPIPRRNLVMSEKRGRGDTGETVIVDHPSPPLEGPPTGPHDPSTTSDARSRLETELLEAAIHDPRRLATEPFTVRTRATPAPTPDGSWPDGSSARGGGRPVPGRSLYDQPLSYLVRQVRPWKRSFWRGVGRRLPRTGRR